MGNIPQSHTLKRIYTAHYRYGGDDRIDITVKGNDPDWAPFKPTWEMVMGVKKGTVSESDYINMYLDIVNKVPVATWDKLLSMEEITLVCFCPQDAFCHRNILTRQICMTLSGRVQYIGWRS